MASIENLSEKPALPDDWKKAVAGYQSPDARQSAWQLANSSLPYFLLWYFMYRSLEVSYWLTLALALPAGAFMIRIFIIFHDCGHGSFFKTRRWNDTVGYLTGILTFTPYYQWRHHHAIHHATAGDLDRRGVGDVKIWTLEEYLAAPGWKKWGYRLGHQPLFMFTLGAWLVFLVVHRLPRRPGGPRERLSVHITNLALLMLFAGLSALFGWQAVLLVQLPILFLAATMGVWLFYIQHNFEGVYWARSSQAQWDFAQAGLMGSSFYKLPGLLQWFSGNIGFHHIHHLSPRVPNYKLQACHEASALFRQVRPVTLRESFTTLRYRLYDEEQRRLVGIP